MSTKIRGHLITAVGWNQFNNSLTSTGPILMGTTRGLIFETEISTESTMFSTGLINWLLYFLSTEKCSTYTAVIWRNFLFHRWHWETMETTLRFRERRAVKCNNWFGISSCSKFKTIFHICHYKFKIISISGKNILNWSYLCLKDVSKSSITLGMVHIPKVPLKIGGFNFRIDDKCQIYC